MDSKTIEAVLDNIAENQDLISGCRTSSGNFSTTYGTRRSAYFFKFKSYDLEVGYTSSFNEVTEVGTTDMFIIIFPEGTKPENAAPENYSVFSSTKQVSETGEEYEDRKIFSKIDTLYELVKSKAIGTDKVIAGLMK